MCGACEDEVFLTVPNPHCVLGGLAPATPSGTASPRRFTATEIVDAAAPLPLFNAAPLLSLNTGRARAAAAARR